MKMRGIFTVFSVLALSCGTAFASELQMMAPSADLVMAPSANAEELARGPNLDDIDVCAFQKQQIETSHADAKAKALKKFKHQLRLRLASCEMAAMGYREVLTACKFINAESWIHPAPRSNASYALRKVRDAFCPNKSDTDCMRELCEDPPRKPTPCEVIEIQLEYFEENPEALFGGNSEDAEDEGDADARPDHPVSNPHDWYDENEAGDDASGNHRSREEMIEKFNAR